MSKAHIRVPQGAPGLGTTLMLLVDQTAARPRPKRQGRPAQNQPACLSFGLVVTARAKHPIPSRTRPLSAAAPMVLRLKTWESRSPPNLTRRNLSQYDLKIRQNHRRTPTEHHPPDKARSQKPGTTVAGWSSPVARQAHNLKVTGSNPVPATKSSSLIKDFKAEQNARLLLFAVYINATSTPHQKNCTRTLQPAIAGIDGQR